jgi:hypothetical protein
VCETFRCIDPRRGRPQLAGLLDDIKLTLMQPELISEDKVRAGVEVYYRSNIVVPPPYGRSMLKICVLFSEDEWGDFSGSVLTVYPVAKPHPLERRIWPTRSDE